MDAWFQLILRIMHTSYYGPGRRPRRIAHSDPVADLRPVSVDTPVGTDRSQA